MTQATVQDAPTRPAVAATPADRFMRRLLRVTTTDRKAAGGAHRAFRTSILVSAIRCIVSYVAVPILIPITAVSGAVAAPISIALSLFAIVNGVVSVRRFWIANHRHRWMYTWFMVVVFAVLAVALWFDIGRLVTGA